MRKINKIILIILIYIGLICLNTEVLAVTGNTIETTTRLRREASTSSDVIELIPQGAELEIIAEEGEWYKVKYVSNEQNLIGYLRKDMLKLSETTVANTNSEEDASNNEDEKENNDEIDSKNNEQETQDTNITEEKSETQNEESVNEEIITEDSECILKLDADVRVLPSINSTITNKINAATSVKVVEIINKWCKIEAENVTGWILLSKVDNKKSEVAEMSATENVAENQSNSEETTQENKEEVKKENAEKKSQNKIFYVSTETLNLRKEAKNNGKILKQLSLNDTVELVEKVDDTWAKVTKGEITGYVSSKYLSETKVEVTSRSLTESRNAENSTGNNSNQTNETANSEINSATGQAIVQFAKTYLGCKYVFGGKGPNKFDCSGFTSYVYKHFGIKVEGVAASQVNFGTEVSRSNLQPGDLILFQGWGTESIGHVGIYIGGNSFIHAANAQKGVIITSLSDSYYSAKYVTARRLI